MNQAADILIPGAAMGGGFLSRVMLIGGKQMGIIFAPKAEGEFKNVVWNKSLKLVEGALSCIDSRANTLAMAAAGSEIAKKALGITINGLNDWVIPARDILEPAYRVLKPGTDKNWCYYRSGENPATGTYGYTPDFPVQTEVEAFRAGGPEAFEPAYYWTSTQYGSDDGCAYVQNFDIGNQNVNRKSSKCHVRLVRMIEI